MKSKSSTKMTIEDIKKEEYLILKEIKRVCKELNLSYYLAYGTLLGAVRHKGFIPWDDDIDIWMKREEYSIFLEKFNSIANPKFKLLFTHNAKDYPFSMPKIVNTETFVQEIFMKPISYLGVWVDIFPLDYASEEDIKDGSYYTIREYKRWAALKRHSTFFGKLKFVWFYITNGNITRKDFHIPISEVIQETQKLAANTKKEKYLRNICCVVDIPKILYSEDFENSVEMQFEDESFTVPAGYDRVLKALYGNYQKPTPVAKQKIEKHFTKAIYRDNND